VLLWPPTLTRAWAHFLIQGRSPLAVCRNTGLPLEGLNKLTKAPRLSTLIFGHVDRKNDFPKTREKTGKCGKTREFGADFASNSAIRHLEICHPATRIATFFPNSSPITLSIALEKPATPVTTLMGNALECNKNSNKGPNTIATFLGFSILSTISQNIKAETCAMHIDVEKSATSATRLTINHLIGNTIGNTLLHR
jgi:hypothetical protein